MHIELIDSTYIASAADNVRIWNFNTETQIKSMDLHKTLVRRVCLMEDGNLIITSEIENGSVVV
jgi:hypothetical protein